MTIPDMSLAVVGVDYANTRGPGRRFEIAMCQPGEAIELRTEPKNPVDPFAVAVYSSRGIQIGYVTAERCSRIAALIGQGVDIQAVFQCPAAHGAVIRVSFDGSYPDLPPEFERSDPVPDFWPDEVWPDD